MMNWLRLLLIAFFSFCLAGLFVFGIALALTSCSSSAQSAKVQKAEADLCKLRAEYKLANAAAGGILTPAPGSPREKLEQAEDNVCAARALVTASDAG